MSSKNVFKCLQKGLKFKILVKVYYSEKYVILWICENVYSKR